MSEQPDPAGGGAAQADDQRTCRFPIGYDRDSGEWTYCEHALPAASGRGRPSDYCGRTRLDPDGTLRMHDRATAFQRKRDLKAEGGGPRREQPPARPVTRRGRRWRSCWRSGRW
jgi:hypothetical protein